MKRSDSDKNIAGVKPRLKEYYQKELVPQLMKSSGYKNPLQVPKLDKIVINVGIGDGGVDQKAIDAAVEEIASITGQQPVITKAKKSISNFKIRKGMPLGCKVTLRGDRMYEFFDRLVNVAMPRIRDFRGVSPKIFDKNGNATLGIKEQTIFPEIDYEKVYRTHGMDICIVTTAKDDEKGREFLTCLGMPFSKR